MSYRSNVYIPLNLLTLLGILLSIFYWPFSWASIALFFSGWLMFVGLGAAVGLHRIFAHRTHTLPRWKKLIVLFCSTMACEGPTIWWCSVHRGLHHRHADTDRDPHSPNHGWYHSIIGWIEKSKVDSLSLRYAPDLLRDKDHRWFQEHYNCIIPSVWFAFFLLFGFHALFYFMLLPSFIGMWRDSFENAITHTPSCGYRNFETNDRSTNVLWMVPFGFGNAFHNNHHYSPASFDFGSGISGRWWEIDLAKIFLPFLGVKNVARDQ